MMTSTAGMQGSATLPLYSMMKGALRGFAKGLAREGGPAGETVNVVSPIAYSPAMTAAIEADPLMGEGFSRQIPLGRVGDPENEVGAGVAMLSGPHARYVTGQTLGIDGGQFTSQQGDDMEIGPLKHPELSLYLGTYTDGPSHDWRAMLDMARAMDVAGVDRVVVSDHVVFGENLDAYADPSIGGQAGGRQPTGPDGSWLEPVTVLTAIAATTTRIRLGTAILLAALRRPAVLAKQLATLDVLSQGRVDLGVGVGWQREEYEAVGLSFADRGRLLDHTLEVCQTLWTQQRASYQSPS